MTKKNTQKKDSKTVKKTALKKHKSLNANKKTKKGTGPRDEK